MGKTSLVCLLFVEIKLKIPVSFFNSITCGSGSKCDDVNPIAWKPSGEISK